MNSPQFWTAIRQIGLAKLNATLMLVVAVLGMAWLLVGRMQILDKDARAAISDGRDPQALRRERLATMAERIEVLLTEEGTIAELSAELAGPRRENAEIRAGMHTAEQVGLRELAERMARILGDWLATYSSGR